MLYTLGEWVVKRGHEDEFVAAWREMAEWTATEVVPGMSAVLVRDRENPSRFVSFGPWESEDQVTSWRASEGFAQRVDAIMPLLEEFVPRTLDPAASVGDA